LFSGTVADRPAPGFDALMSPRVIHIPLSGRDRRHFLRELRRVEQVHPDLVGRAEAAYAAAHRLACEEWNARQFIGGDAEPSPQIRHAIDAGCTQLEARCPQCRSVRFVDLTEVIWPRDKPVHTLRRVLFCQQCKVATGRMYRPQMIALRSPEPPSQPAPAAMRRPGTL